MLIFVYKEKNFGESILSYHLTKVVDIVFSSRDNDLDSLGFLTQLTVAGMNFLL